MSSRKSTWKIQDTTVYSQKAKEIAKGLGVTDLTATLLLERAQEDIDACRNFISSPSNSFHSPFLLKDMDRACERIIAALEKNERIVIYGDYDVDGVTSVSSLYLYLSSKGANVGYYIPNRACEGYGASKEAIKSLYDDGAQLIVTVDTGTTATEEAVYAASLGVDMIITDHHECHCELPQALAVVNPMRADCEYPFRSLAGVGVVFKLVCALEETLSKDSEEVVLERMMKRCGDLVAIGTVADVMPMTDENRFIVRQGLELARNTKNRGLAALIDVSLSSVDKFGNKKTKKLTSTSVGYIIAPRINAAGRIANAARAVELFLTDSDDEARAIAEELCEMNRERQKEENDIITEASGLITEMLSEDDKIIVLDHDGWHNGVIGIVSSRLTEQYDLPSILISFDGDVGKGSGRSIPGVNLVEALGECSDLLIKFGGHELAAGLTIERKNLSEFRERINKYVREKMRELPEASKVSVDYVTKMNEITLPQAIELSKLEPFGIANPLPVFMLEDALVSDVVSLSQGKHTKLQIERDGITLPALAFGRSSAMLGVCAGERVSLVYTMDINEFRGTQSVQMIIKEISRGEEAEAQEIYWKNVYRAVKNDPEAEREADVVPTRDDLAAVYIRLKQTVSEENPTVNFRCFSSAKCFDGRINYAKLRFCLDILFECGIINMTPVGDGEDCADVVLSFIKNKINIEKSGIYRRLCRRIDK